MSPFGTSSGARMLISTHFMQSSGHPLTTVPLSAPGSPRSLVSVAGNGPHPHSPCRYAYVARPARYTKGDHPKVWAMGPQTMRHHRPPTRGIQDDEHHSR